MKAPAIHEWLGFEAVKGDDGAAEYRLRFQEAHIGNPAIRALHGGVVAMFLECAAQEALREQAGDGVRIETINIDVDYLESTMASDMFARAHVARSGRRIAFVEATGWQEDPEKPAASARVRLRLIDDRAP